MKFAPTYLRQHKEYERTNQKPLTKIHPKENSAGASSTYYGLCLKTKQNKRRIRERKEYQDIHPQMAMLSSKATISMKNIITLEGRASVHPPLDTGAYNKSRTTLIKFKV